MKRKFYLLSFLVVLVSFSVKATVAPPTFVKGAVGSFSICENSSSSIDSFLVTFDTAKGLNLTWSIDKNPLNGTMHGFNGSGSSNGGNVSPTGFSYNANNGYIGNDSFSIKVSDGSLFSTIKIIVHVQSGPVISAIKGTTSFCVGNNTTLTDSTTGGTWSSSNTAVATINTTGVVNGIAAGNSTISYSLTNASRCNSVVTTLVTLNAYPTVPAITGTNTVCQGLTTTFSDNTKGGVWTSSNTNFATIDTNGIITGILGTTNGNRSTITYTVTNGTCSTAVTRGVTVYSKPTINPITGNTSICNGGNTTLADATRGGTWASSNTAIAVVTTGGGGAGGGGGRVTTLKAGTDTITYTVAAGGGGGGNTCSADTFVVLTVNPVPVVGAINGTVNSLCVGKTTSLTDTTAGGIWSSSNTANATVDTNGLVKAITAGTVNIIYTVTNAAGCSTAVQYALTIRSNPTLLGISGTNNTCINSPVTFTDNTGGGVWSSSNTNIATVSTGGVVKGIAVGTDTIHYTLTSTFGCVTDSIHGITFTSGGLTVKPITGANVLCLNTSITLADSTNGGIWTSSDSTVASPNGSTILGLAVGSATITYTVTNGCSGFATYNINVYQPPVVPEIVGNASVCLGDSIQLTDSLSGGFWTSSNTSIVRVNTKGLVRSVTSGTATIYYTVNGLGGCSKTVNKVITINALPILNKIIGSNSTCLKSIINYTDSTINGTWTISDPTIGTIQTVTGPTISTGHFVANAVGTAFVKYTFTNGIPCSASDSIKVTVNTNFVISPIVGKSSVCLNKTITLTDSTTGGTWVPRNPSIANITAAGVVTGVTVGTAYIIDSFNNVCGITKDSILITVDSVPAAPRITGAPVGNFLCAGNTSQLTGTPTGGAWSSLLTNVAIVSSTGLVTGITSGGDTIYYGVSNPAGCKTYASQYFNIGSIGGNPLPGITGTTTVCEGDSSKLSNTTSGGKWTSSNSSIATVDSTTGWVKGLKAGTVIIDYAVPTGIGAFNCPRTASVSFTVNAVPAITRILGKNAVCANSNLLLTDNTGGGVWSSSQTNIATIDAGLGIVNALSAGTDTIKYTITNSTTNCSSTVLLPITVNPLPANSPITGNASVCFGKTTTLTDATTGGAWFSTNPAVSTITATGVVNAVSVGTDTIYYKETDVNNNCTDSVFVSLKVNALPTPGSIGGASAVCIKSNTLLTDTTIGGQWLSTNNKIATVSGGNVTGIAVGTDTISYVVTNAAGCTDTVTKTITVNPLPVIGSITGNASVCVGKTIVLSDTTAGGIVFDYNPSVASYSPINSSSILVTGNSVGVSKISYTVTNTYGCTDSINTNVVVNGLPVIAAINGTNSVCVKGTTQLTNNTNGGTWYSTNNAIATINNNGLVTGIKAGIDTIKYVVINSNSCSDTVILPITVNPLPVIGQIKGNTTLCAKSAQQLSDTSLNGSWSAGNTAVLIINSNGYITGVTAGSSLVKYTITNNNGCTDSVSANITVNALPVIGQITGNTAVCIGKTTLLTDTSVNGIWKSISPNVATINNNGSVTAVAAGNTIIRYIVTNTSLCTDSVSTSITVNPLPVLTPIAGLTSICLNQSTTLSSSPAGGVWSSSNANITSINNAGSITGINAGNDTIIYTFTNNNGCINSVSINDTVNALPVVATIAGINNVCIGKTTSLSETTNGGVWSTSNAAIATVNNGLVKGVSAGKAAIIYTVTNGNGCTSFVTDTVTVNSLPVVASITGATSICLNQSTTLTSSTPGGVWISSNSNITSVNNNGFITGVAVGNDTIAYTVTNSITGCINSVIIKDTVNVLPVVATIAGINNVCIGKTTSLSETTNGGVWSTSNASIATVNNGLVKGVSAGKAAIIYTVTNGNGCTSFVTDTVTVNSLPVVASITGATSICLNQSTTLTSSTPGGVWISSNSNITSVNNNGFITGVAVGSDTIIYTVTNSITGCINSVSINDTVNALPVIAAITGINNVCIGKTTPLSENTNGGLWSTSNASIATVNNGLVKGVSAGKAAIIYTVTNGNGCTSFVTDTVTVNTLPVLSPITGASSICLNQTANLSSSPSGGVWSASNTNISINNAGLITGNASGIDTITYTYTNNNGCTNWVSYYDTVNTLPVVAAINGVDSVCVGKTTQLFENTNGGTWSSGNAAIATVNNGWVSGLSAGKVAINYTVTNNNGCTTIVTDSAKVNALPVLNAITGISSVCVGSSLNPAINNTGGIWSLNNNLMATIDSVTGVVKTYTAGTDTLVYTVTNQSGCISYVTAPFVINAVPAITAIGSNSPIHSGDTLYLTASSPISGVTYNWTGPNGFTANTQNPFIAATPVADSGTYYVSAMFNNCTSVLDSVTVAINTVYIVNGNIKTPKGFALNGATLNITGSATQASTTNVLGDYTLQLDSLNNATYYITPYKNNDVIKSNGVNSLDIALMQAHILQKTLLNSPYKIIAADVNGDGKVNSLDIVYMKRLILGIDSTFKNAKTGINRLWGFVDSGYKFPDTANPFNSLYPPFATTDTITNLNANSHGNSFVGYKLGDVDWSWNPAKPRTFNTNKVAVELSYPTTYTDENGLVRIPVTAKNFQSIIGMQFTLNYNKEVFDFVQINKNQLGFDFAHHQDAGSLSFLWNEMNNNISNLNENTVLFELVLSKKAEFVQEDITIDSRVTSAEATDNNLEQHDVVKNGGMILNNSIIQATNDYVMVGPNPNNGKFNMVISSIKNKEVSISITDVNGKVIMQQKHNLMAGKNVISFDLSNRITTATGNFVVKMEEEKRKNTFKILIQK